MVNKSHSVAYAVICFMTAFFKAHYPIEFMAALLTVFGDNEDKVRNYIEDAKRMGFRILPPDVNSSDTGFTIEDKSLRYGLASIKSLGTSAIEKILEARPFTSLADMIERIPKKNLNKTAVEALALSGALDELSFGIDNRKKILSTIYKLRGDKKIDMEDEIKAFDHKAKLEEEQRLMGLFVSGHPLDNYAKPVDWDQVFDGASFDTAGFVTSYKETVTRRGDKMAFINIDTLEGNRRIVAFPNEYAAVADQIEKGIVLKLTLTKKYDPRYDERSYIVKKATIPKRINKTLLQARELDI